MARAQSHEYRCWVMMKQRCLNPKATGYYRYGGAGVTVCQRWMNYWNFFLDMGPAPTPKHTLDRWPDKNGHYEPGNVRWATPSEQAKNVRHSYALDEQRRQAREKGAAACKGKPWSIARRVAQQRRGK